MEITQTLLKINSTTITGLAEYKVQLNKLWTDSDRNMKGELRSVFIGIFPKLLLNFRTLNRDEMSTVIGLLNNPSFTVEWYDESSDTTKSGLFYAGDFDIDLMSKKRGLYKPFTVNLIAFNKI